MLDDTHLLFIPNVVVSQKSANIFNFCKNIQCFLLSLPSTTTRLSDIKGRRALLNSSFLSNSRKIGYGVGCAARTLTLWIYTIMNGELYTRMVLTSLHQKNTKSSAIQNNSITLLSVVIETIVCIFL